MKSLKSRLIAILASTVMVIAGFTPVAANAAGSPYNFAVLGTYASPAMELVAANNRVYYKVGGQLWTSDGTTQTMVADFGASTSVSIGQTAPRTQISDYAFSGDTGYVNHSVLIGNKFYFWGYTGGAWTIWVTDGTVVGTRNTTAPAAYIGSPHDWILPNLYAMGNSIYFWFGWNGPLAGASSALSADLYRADFSGASVAVTNITASGFKSTCYNDDWQSGHTVMQQDFGTVNNKLIFDYSIQWDGQCINNIAAYDPSAPAGSQLARLGKSLSNSGGDIRVSNPQQFVNFKNRLYFYADVNDDNASELWYTDGTNNGTDVAVGVDTVFGGAYLRNDTYMKPTVIGDYLYFAGISVASQGNAIFRVDALGNKALWIPSATLGGPGRRSNASATVLGSGATAKLIVDGKPDTDPHNWEQYAVDVTAKTATKLIETADSYWGGVGCGNYCSADQLTSVAESATWDGKAWWTAVSDIDNDGGSPKVRDIYYSDGTPAGTAKLTNNGTVYSGSYDDGNYTIGYQGSSYGAATAAGWGQIPNNAWASKPLVVANDRVFYLSGNGKNATSWTLNSITRVTVPITCGSVMSKLKIEADSASDLAPKFATATCEYSISVDYKTSKMDFTPTFSPSTATVIAGGNTVSTSLKSTKTQTVTLGAAGTNTVVDFVFGANTYRITVTRKAPPTAGGRDPQFTPPVIAGGAVKSIAKGKKVETKNGKETKVAVTVIGGSFDEKVKKLDENGKEDENFKNNVPAITGSVNKVSIDENARVVVAGNISNGNDKDIIRLKSDGEKDESFKSQGNSGGSNAEVKDVEIQKDGKIVVAGDLDNNGKNVTRLKDDGSKDTTFAANVPTFNGPVNTVKVQDDGKILVGGSFTNVANDPTKDNIVRLNKDGSLDNSFDPGENGSHFNDEVKDIETSKDGKIVVVGKSEKGNDENEADHVARLKEDGHEDPTFNHAPDLGGNEVINTVKVKDNGEVFIGGDFHDVGDGDGDNIAKLKKDGTPDTDWNPPAQAAPINDISVGDNGKVTIAGDGDPNDGEHDDRMDKLQDNDPSNPRYDSIDNEQSVNNVPTGTAGQTTIHGDGFTDGTTVTVGGKPATVVSIDDRDEEIVIQVPKPDNDHKGDSTHEPKPADVVIQVPNEDPIVVPEAFAYTDIKEPQVIKPLGEHIDSDLADEDGKGTIYDSEALTAYIPSDEPIVTVSKTPEVCEVDVNNQVTYLERGVCKLVTDAPGNMGFADPAPVTEVIPVLGLDPVIVVPDLPADPAPDTGLQLPLPTLPVPELPVTYTVLTPDTCTVSDTGLVVPIDITQSCSVSLATPGNTVYEPKVAPPIVIPTTAWIAPIPDQVTGVITDPATTVSIPGAGGTVANGDVSFTYNKAKGTLTPAASGIYFGPIKATISYTWTKSDSTTGSGTCSVSWGVLKKWSKLSKADQKKYKKPLAMKSFTTTSSCKVSAAAKAALAVAGTTFTANSDVLRTRMWPATYLPKKPNNERIAPRLRHLTVTINTN